MQRTATLAASRTLMPDADDALDDVDVVGNECNVKAMVVARRIEAVPVSCEAWMLMKGTGSRMFGGQRFRPRYFVLDRGVLRHYDSPSAAKEGRPKEEFVLRGCKVETVKRKNVVHIVFKSSETREVDLVPGCAVDTVRWRRMLQIGTMYHMQEKVRPIQAVVRRVVPLANFLHTRMRILHLQACTRRWAQRRPYIEPMKHTRRLAKIMLEIRSTERTYVTSLASLAALCEPLRKEIASKVKDQSLSTLLVAAQNIYDMHQVLLGRLDEAMSYKHHDTRSRLPKCFSSVFAQTDVYKVFVNAHDKAVAAIRKKAPRGSSLAEKLGLDGGMKGGAKGKAGVSAPDVESLLIQPIQRLPRYALMMDEMIKSLHEGDPAREEYAQIAKMVKKATKGLNEANRWACARAKVQEVMSTLTGLDPAVVNALNSPEQTFVREAVIPAQYSNHATQERHVFLFSNVLLVCKQPKLSLFATSYEFKRAVWLPMAKLQQDTEGGSPLIRIITPSETHTLRPADSAVATDWMRTLQGCLDGLDNVPDTLLQEALVPEVASAASSVAGGGGAAAATSSVAGASGNASPIDLM